MEAVVRKWGNSLGIRIPGSLAKDVSLKDGSFVSIEEIDGKIIIQPQNTYRLDDMLSKISTKNIHEEVEISGPIGNEIW